MSPSPGRHVIQSQHPRRRIGIVSDGPPAALLEVNADAHIISSDAQGGVVAGYGFGVEDGIVLLELGTISLRVLPLGLLTSEG